MSGKHISNPAEADWLRFTKKLSKICGSKHNILSPFTVATPSAFQQPEESLFDPIVGCLCEVKARDEGIIVCPKNCCCTFFHEPCLCGLEAPGSPPKIINAVPSVSNNGQTLCNTNPDMGTNTSESACNKLKKHELRTTEPYRSIRKRVKRCSHGPHEQIKENRRSFRKLSKGRPKTRNSTADPQTS